MVLCPECDSDLDLEEEDLNEGEIVSCAECGTDFEVVGVDPLELSRIKEEDEEDVEIESENGSDF